MAGTGPLLTAKSRVPPVPASLVPRSRLARLLDGGRTPVTVVTAGAGWGKTTLLAAWVRTVRGPVAWLTLDAGDDDPARFWTYVATALSGPAPEATGRALAALAVPSVDPLDVAVPELLNGLADVPQPLLLVLDDLHEVTDRRVTEGLEFLLDHQPPALRVVLAGRTEPPVGLARLRARGRLTEIGQADLRFTDDEARQLLAAVAGPAPPDGAVPGVLHRSAGWAAGLVLGGLALRDRRQGRPAPAGLPGQEHALAYLVTEVLHGQPAQRQELLLRTAPLDRFSGALVDAVLGRTRSAAALAGLQRDGLFVTTADGEWFRMHPLFRTALLQELADPELVADLRRRAAAWFLDAGLPEDAVRALLAAGDSPAAAAALVAHTATFIESGRVGVFAQLGGLLDPAATASVPLLASLAWAAGVTGRLDRVPGLLDRAEARLRAGAADPGYPGFASTAGLLASLRSVYGTLPDAPPGTGLALARRAVAEETDPRLPGWVVARVALGGALLGTGDDAAALAVVETAWQAPAVEVLPAFSRLEVAGLLGWCLVRVGAEQRARLLLGATAEEAADVESALGDAAAPAVALLHAVAAELDQRDGDLRAARRRSARAAELVAVQAHPAIAALVLVAAAAVALHCGEGRAALALLDRAAEARREAPPDPGTDARIAELTGQAGAQAATQTRATLSEPLTERELAVLRALRGDLSLRGIGGSLHLSVNTVKGYAKGLYRKLGVASRAEAVARGRELGLC